MSIFRKIAGIFRKEKVVTKELPATTIPPTNPPPTNPNPFNLPPIPTNPIYPKPPSKPGGGGEGGTYYPSSGTYVSSEGVGMSIQTPPTGATISSGNNPQLPPPKPSLSSDIQRVRNNNAAAAALRQEAARRGTDISTSAREKGFLYNLKKEQISGTYIKKKQQPFYDVNKKAYINEEGVGMSMPFENVPIGTPLKGNTAIFGTKTVNQPSIQQQDIFTIIKESQSYGELGSKLYNQKVPTFIKTRVSNVGASFTRGTNKAANLIGIKTLPTLEKVYQTSPLIIPETQFILLGVGATPKAIGLQKFKVVEPLRPTKEPYAIETIQTEVNLGKPTRYSYYNIFTEKAPSRVTYTTSLNEMVLGKTPKNIKILPAITAETKTPFYATTESPFITLETKGGKVGKLAEVSGTSQRIEISNYPSLPKNQQFLIERLTETKTGGVPVSSKNIPYILDKEDIRFLSDIDVSRLGKIKLSKDGSYLEPVLPRKLGIKTPKYNVGLGEPYFSTPQKTTRFQTITETKMLKVPQGMEDVYQLSKSKVVFKEVTFPFSRATGKTPKLIVYTKEYLEPIVVSKEPIKFIQTGNIKKTPFGNTFQIQKSELKTLVRTSPPKVSKARTTTKVISSPIETTTFTSSAYAGLGLYERTEGGQVPKSVNVFSVKSFTSPLSKETSATQPKFIFKTGLKEEQKVVLKPMAREISKTIPKEITKTIQKPTLKLTSKTIQKQIQKPITKIPTPTITITRTPSRTKPRTPPNFPKFFTPSQTSKGGSFVVSVRRFGKFKPFGIFGTQQKAFAFGKFKTSKTLAATFKVSGSGVKQPQNIFGYRRKLSKKEGIVFIEEPKWRLSTPTEKSEIYSFRKLKGGRLF